MEQKKKRANEDYIIMAEYRLLNALIHNPAFHTDSRIHSNTFAHSIAKSFYKAITSMHEANKEITVASLHQAANEIDFNASLEVTKQIFNIDTGASHIDDIIRVLEKAVQKQQFTELIYEISRTANQKGELDLTALMSKLYDAEQILEK